MGAREIAFIKKTSYNPINNPTVETVGNVEESNLSKT